jgi:SAM-dependent methyltransferase
MSPNRPSDLTVAYYDAHAGEYARDTLGVDLASLYEPFLVLIPAGGHILDVGCGSGRDSLAFLGRGFRVTAIDASREMARVAGERIDQAVAVIRVQDLTYENQFDGIWACASLLHVRRREMDDVLFRLGRALRVGGVLYMSFKWGDGERVRQGRLFNDYTEDAFQPLLAGHELLTFLRAWRTDDVRPEKRGEKWLNLLAGRRARTAL